MPELKLTNTEITAIPHPQAGQVLYRDTQLRGFGVRVGTRSKVFFVEGQVNARTQRVTIGRADVLSADAARKKALTLLADMATEKSPNQEKRLVEAKSITLARAFDDFFEAKPHLSPHTVIAFCSLYRLVFIVHALHTPPHNPLFILFFRSIPSPDRSASLTCCCKKEFVEVGVASPVQLQRSGVEPPYKSEMLVFLLASENFQYQIIVQKHALICFMACRP